MIDRRKLVKKHNPKITAVDKHNPLSIGNGEFVFTADITGLQSFNEIYEDGCPLCTMANWGWHTTPFSDEIYKIEKSEISQEFFETNGRKVGYYTSDKQKEKYDSIRQNPHKYNLGKVGFVFSDHIGRPQDVNAIKNIEQELDIYTGILSSSYDVEDVKCVVRTCCDSETDSIAINAESRLISEGKMFIKLAFPYPSHEMNGSDWKNIRGHVSRLVKLTSNSYKIERTIDREGYSVYITGEGCFDVEQTEAHAFVIRQNAGDAVLNMNIGFACVDDIAAVSNKSIFENSESSWKSYWENGGIIRFSKSTNKMANELERRVILSQYLTAIQCCGKIPPAETGLTCNSWYGKFHLEMHFWHAAHFALFNRLEKLEKSLGWYVEITDEAKALAKSQGYEGARWPKMVSREGIDSPSPIGPLLIWQQPHVLLYCDCCYRSSPTMETLQKYETLVYETAAFMASYAEYDERNGRYVLGPPVIPVQERHAADKTLNPAFELEYWIYGLKIASDWLGKMGLSVPEKWTDIIKKLALPTISNGVYMAQENCLDTFEKVNTDHPSMLMAYGIFGSNRIDADVMNATFDRVVSEWEFKTLWGWDFGVMAMTAARLGRRQDAVNILLKETAKNVYVANGHNRQVSQNDLPLYLPGNGALLLAVAMMVSDFGNNEEGMSGFPKDGGWEVEYENISKCFLQA